MLDIILDKFSTETNYRKEERGVDLGLLSPENT